jgi:hypothetical protein
MSQFVVYQVLETIKLKCFALVIRFMLFQNCSKVESVLAYAKRM